VIVGLALLFGGIGTDMSISFVPYLRAIAANHWQLQVLEPASIAASAVGIVYLFLAVQCPQCGARWIWMAANGKLKGLVILDRCPKCGYAGMNSGDTVNR